MIWIDNFPDEVLKVAICFGFFFELAAGNRTALSDVITDLCSLYRLPAEPLTTGYSLKLLTFSNV